MLVTTFDAKTHLSALLDEVIHHHETITITRRGTPVAQLVPVKRASAKAKKSVRNNQRTRSEWATKLRADRAQLFKKYGLFPDSAELIRREREERG